MYPGRHFFPVQLAPSLIQSHHVLETHVLDCAPSCIRFELQVFRSRLATLGFPFNLVGPWDQLNPHRFLGVFRSQFRLVIAGLFFFGPDPPSSTASVSIELMQTFFAFGEKTEGRWHYSLMS